MIVPKLAPPETNVLKVVVRATVSAESLTLSVVKLGVFWMVRAPRMPCTLPALPTLTVSWPNWEFKVVATPVARTLTTSSPALVMRLTPLVPAYL